MPMDCHNRIGIANRKNANLRASFESQEEEPTSVHSHLRWIEKAETDPAAARNQTEITSLLKCILPFDTLVRSTCVLL